VFNDISFDLMSIADTQVYDGSSVQMYFLDRQGNRVSGYVNSDCVFIEVIEGRGPVPPRADRRLLGRAAELPVRSGGRRF